MHACLAALIAHLRGEATLPRGPARAEPNDPIPLDLALPTPGEPSDSLLVVTTRALLLDAQVLARLLPTLTPNEANEPTKIHDLVDPTRLLHVADLQPERDAAVPLDADTLALAEQLAMEGR